MCAIEPGRLSKRSWTRPGRRSFIAGAPPRYGTWVILMPAMAIKSSADICGDAPVPDDAKLTLPGLAFTYSMNSATFLAGTDGIGRGAKDGSHADVPAGANPVFYYDLLAQFLCKELADNPGDGVVGTSRRE